jgi:F-type H+-transporting ATPase subunit b
MGLKRKIPLNILTIVSAALVANPNIAHAASDHAAAAGVETLIFPIINFTLFAFAVVYLYRKYGAPILMERRVQFETRLNSSQRLLVQAEQDLAAVSDRLASFDEERQEILTSLKREGEAMAEQILRNAQANAEAIDRDGKRRAEREYQQAVGELRRLVVEQASQKARRKLEQNLSAEDDRRLRQAAINSLFG